MLPPDVELANLYAYPTSDRAWVRTNFVATVDGAATAADGVSGSLGGASDGRVFALLRSLADVVVVGAGTARAEGYGVVLPGDVDADLRRRLGLAPVPPIAVVSRSLDVPEALATTGQLVVTTVDAAAGRDRTTGGAEVIARGEGTIDWPAVLVELASRGLRRVLCEGGPSLHGELVAHDLVDEVCLTIAPVMASGPAPRIAHGPDAVARPMTLGHVLQADGGMLTRWVRDRS